MSHGPFPFLSFITTIQATWCPFTIEVTFKCKYRLHKMIIIFMLIVLMILLSSPHSLPQYFPCSPALLRHCWLTIHCTAWPGRHARHGVHALPGWVQRPDCGVSHSNYGQGRLGNVEQVRGARYVLVLWRSRRGGLPRCERDEGNSWGKSSLG